MGEATKLRIKTVKNREGKLIMGLYLIVHTIPVVGHGGQTDSSGGHHDQSTGRYHCHSEPCLSNEAHAQQAYEEAVQEKRSVSKTYDRDDWPHWIDADHDCQDTRAEMLILYSTEPVRYSNPSECRVTSGRWFDPYTGNTYSEAGDLDIDHIVPLSHAHRTGGADWTKTKKTEFANDIANLLPVDDSTNQSKGDKSPDQWRPPSEQYWCRYAKRWKFIKNRYQLKITPVEASALTDMLITCQ